MKTEKSLQNGKKLEKKPIFSEEFTEKIVNYFINDPNFNELMLALSDI